MKILMVCLGNICRSPLAEGIMKAKLDKYNFPYSVDSAGTGNWHEGEAPDHRSVKIALENGVDISEQRARGFRQEDFDRFDRIYVMDKSNYRTLVDRTSELSHHAKIKLIMDEGNEIGKEVPDPYYGNLNDFRDVYRMLDDICEEIVLNFVEKSRKS
jgi:protein-tyrosine phosphatase